MIARFFVAVASPIIIAVTNLTFIPLVANAATLFQDNFESYTLNTWPSAAWTGFGGNDSNHNVNRIELDPINSDNQVFRLSGIVGNFWGAGAVSDVAFPDHFLVNLRVYNGDESLPNSGHQNRGQFGMRFGHYWNSATNPSRSFLRFHKDGNIYAGTEILQSYETNRWYDISVEYDRLSNSQVDLRYWINNVNKGTYSFPIENLSNELSLNHIELTAQAGSVYYDNVQVHTLSGGDELSQESPEKSLALPLPNSSNLVVYTHGINTDEAGFRDGAWQALGDALSPENLPAGWEVYGHDWTDKNGRFDLTAPVQNSIHDLLAVLPRAAAEGRRLGKELAAKEYAHVHFIGHSAGSALIEEAARYIEIASNGSVETHTTFLDPFTPFPLNTSGGYGAGADWADNYSSLDVLPFTQPILSRGHNVDVTGVKIGSDSSSFLTGHGWPVQFYVESILNSDPNWEGAGYGFALSQEAGAWPLDTSMYPPGNEWVVLGGGLPIEEVSPTFRLDGAVDVSRAPYEKSDSVALTENAIDMTTASPAWFTMLLDTVEPVNFVTFDVEFLSEPGAEGLLAMYWDGEVVSTIDERYALPGNNRYTMWLSETVQPGIHELSFRLDPITAISSRAILDNVQTGLVAIVPEPSCLVLVIVGLAAFAWRPSPAPESREGSYHTIAE